MIPEERSFTAAQAFLLEAKVHWTREIYPALRTEYEARIAGRPQPRTAAEAEALIGGSTLYHCFAWMERHLQRMKYSGRYGLHPYHAQRRSHLEGVLRDAKAELKPAIRYPDYYTSVDIHQHPGGVWSDPVAGFVYERGARSTTPLSARRHKDLHDRLTAAAIERAGKPARVLDMGCGFGKSTRPFCEALPEARIEAIDLSEPCLRLAARDASQSGVENVRFRQVDAAQTDYPDASFDLVTSTMLLHEMPPPVVERTLAETKRVLKPGGRMVHLDFLPDPDAFDQLIHFGHGRRNNEPFMEPLARMGLEEKLKAMGFRDVEIVPFAEADGVLEPDYRYWRFPWTLSTATR
jgi:ubiquinone/menaquinone biosynthesis C-methylase UbiE